MKKLGYIFVLLLGLAFYTCVYADYKEGDFTSPSCSSYTSELKESYDDYFFDKKSGKFKTEGRIYEESIKNLSSLTFYRTSKDKRTLYIYVPSYNNNIILLDDYNLPKQNCEKTYKAMKSGILLNNKTMNSKSNSVKANGNKNDKSNSNKEENNKNDEKSSLTTKKTSKEKSSDSTEDEEFKQDVLTLVLLIGLVIAFCFTTKILRKKNLIE